MKDIWECSPLKQARWKNRSIDLKSLHRSEYPLLYKAAKNSEVFCLHCGNEVALYIGIQRSPYFYHKSPNAGQNCHENIMQQKEAHQTIIKEEYVETGGFRLPKERSIQKEDNHPVASTWKPTRKAVIQKPFHMHQLRNIDDEFSLDSDQLKAVETTNGPVLVLAGAGSGKTRVLAARAVRMISKNIDPRSMMLVTFTTKAAHEMKERIAAFLQKQNINSNLPLTGTFHSIFYRILCHHNPMWKDTSRLLKWSWQKEQYIYLKLRELGIEEKDFPFDQAFQQISFWKNMMITPEKVTATNEWEQKIKQIYEHYEHQKEQHHTFDFDDMLIKCYELFQANPKLLAKYQQRFHHFFIDEFQDINPVQFQLMKMLSNHSQNVFAVGDDDQAIYSFRGSDPTIILNFQKAYPSAKIIHLKTNYRSSHEIVSCAQSIIEKNKNRYRKQVFAQFQNEEKPLFFFPYDEEEEATMIVQDIKEKIEQGANPNDFAILYRTHSMSRAIFERLSESSMPFQLEKDYESFYEKKMVKCILAFLRLSVNPDDFLAMGDFLSAMFIKQSVLQDLKAITILQDCSFLEALLKLEGLQAFQMAKLKKVNKILPTLKRMKPIHALDVIEKDLGFADFLKKRGHEGNKIEKGSDEIHDLKVVAKNFQTVQSFLEHIDHIIAKTKDKKKELTSHGIQLMTIHRAKGLEFENVYILAAVDGGLPHDFALEQYRNGENDSLEEERRLLYVAITRAKRFVAISVLETRRGKMANPSRFIKHLLNYHK